MTKKKKAEVSKIQKISTALGNVYGNEKLAFGIGLILMALAVYFTIAFISYFTTGNIDQSYIDNIKPGEVVDTTLPTNAGHGGPSLLTSSYARDLA